MNAVEFNEATREITYCDDNGEICSFGYKRPKAKLWRNINLKNFKVELLINPYLNRQDDVFPICTDSERIGYLLPISVLDSSEELSGRKYQNVENYILIAFMALLNRIEQLTDTAEFYKNFEDNIIVAVFHLPSCKTAEPLPCCIHDLRRYGYSYFEDYNRFLPVEKYSVERFEPEGDKISTDLKVPSLYNDSVIDALMREYQKVNNAIHRFILLYQVIEHLMDLMAQSEIERLIKIRDTSFMPHNEFLDKIRDLNSEKKKIRIIFDRCGITPSDFNDFRRIYQNLCNKIKFVLSVPGDVAEVFYSFRNNMVHSYRNMHKFENEFAATVQEFEFLILKIVSTYSSGSS